MILIILLLAAFIYPPFIAKAPIGYGPAGGYEVVIHRSWEWIFSSPRYSGLIMELDFKTILAESVIAILLTIGICLIPFKGIGFAFKIVLRSKVFWVIFICVSLAALVINVIRIYDLFKPEEEKVSSKQLQDAEGKVSSKTLQDAIEEIHKKVALDEIQKRVLSRKQAKEQPNAYKPGVSGIGNLYKEAFETFQKGDLEGARRKFEASLKQYPNAGLSENAQFWIGETYFLKKDFEKAILEYEKVIVKYPEGNKVPGALLKQGLAFFELGDKTNARNLLRRVIERYPQSNQAEIAKKKLDEIK